MSRPVQGLLLAAVLAATCLGFGALYSLRLSQGDDFPAYSSLRSDPLGTRALFESLSALPGMRVARRFQPLDQVDAAATRTILVAGLDLGQWNSFTPEEFGALDSAVRAGSRLVLTMKSEFTPESAGYFNDTFLEMGPAAKKAAEKKAEDKKPEDKKSDAKPAARLPPRMVGAEAKAKAPKTADLKRLWGISLSTHKFERFDKGAVPAPDAPKGLPGNLVWKSGLYFDASKGASWRVIYDDFGKSVILEMPYGRGSIVVAGDSYFLSNEALLKNRSTALLAWVIGPNTRVEFDESHLGVVEDVGMAALARRYGMAWAFGTLLLLAGLFIWRRMALFVPPPGELPDTALSCSHTAALEALFLRSVQPGELIATCVAEWRRTAAPKDVARLETAFAASSASSALAAYNAAARALKRR